MSSILGRTPPAVDRKAGTVGYLEGGVSAAGNAALFAVKLWAGIAFSSVAIVAGALHIRLPASTPLGDAHETATAVEEVIRDRMGMEATVHTEPL